MKNREKFNRLVSTERTNTIQRNKDRIKNRARLRESQDIAIKVLERLDMMDWTQRKFAEKLEVSPQQVNKIVKGKENLTLETIVKIQEVLNISILLTHQERKIEARLDNFLKEVNTPVYQLNPKKKLVEVKVKTMEVIIQDSDIYNDGEKTQKYA